MQVLEGLGRLGHSDAEGFPPANVHVLSDVSDQLAVKALSSSTQDRPEEDTKHVLTRSRCQTGSVCVCVCVCVCVFVCMRVMS